MLVHQRLGRAAKWAAQLTVPLADVVEDRHEAHEPRRVAALVDAQVKAGVSSYPAHGVTSAARTAHLFERVPHGFQPARLLAGARLADGHALQLDPKPVNALHV